MDADDAEPTGPDALQSERGAPAEHQQATVLAHQSLDGGLQLLRLLAPRCAQIAQAGMLLCVRDEARGPWRRPLSPLRVSAQAGWIELLYTDPKDDPQPIGQPAPGDGLTVIGPFGRAFAPHAERPRRLLIADGVGIAPVVFLAERLHAQGDACSLVIVAAQGAFPFRARPSGIVVPGMPEGVIAAMPLLEDWGIASRLASPRWGPGCYEGEATDLARAWLDALGPQRLREVEVFACGPRRTLERVERLARDYDLPCQLSLELLIDCRGRDCASCTIAPFGRRGQSARPLTQGAVFTAEDLFGA